MMMKLFEIYVLTNWTLCIAALLFCDPTELIADAKDEARKSGVSIFIVGNLVGISLLLIPAVIYEILMGYE
jgi:hypothetical protein